MSNKTIAVCFVFASSSDPKKFYDTLQYTDGTTSCPCPGWTRRVAPDGSRSCTHTRMIDAGMGEQAAVRVTRYAPTATLSRARPLLPLPAPKVLQLATNRPKARAKVKKPAQVQQQPQPVTRRFEF
jgi:hypothetical protein